MRTCPPRASGSHHRRRGRGACGRARPAGLARAWKPRGLHDRTPPLWIPPRTNAVVGRIEDLASSEVRVIAVAKPELAPYGQAAIDALKHAGIWDKVQPKIVYAENIGMAKQYGMSGNADAVFTSYSLVLREGGKVIQVDQRLYQPLIQEIGIIARSHHREAARKFVEFLLSGEGREVLREYGYRSKARADGREPSRLVRF